MHNEYLTLKSKSILGVGLMLAAGGLFGTVPSARSQENSAPATVEPPASSPDDAARKDRRRDRQPAERRENGSQASGHDAGRGSPEFQPLELLPEQLQAMEAFVQSHLPHLWEDLSINRGTNPRGYERDMAVLFPRVAKLMRDRDADPEAFELGVKIEDVEVVIRRKVRRYNNLTDPTQKESLKSEIHGLLGERFDLEQTRGLRQVEALEKRLVALRAQIESRAKNKNEITTIELTGRLSPDESNRRPPKSGHGSDSK